MQNIYVLRSLYPALLRLGLSATLLLGSAGLAVAASLLLYTAAQPTVLSPPAPAASTLETTYFGTNTVPLTSLAASSQPAYTYAASLGYAGPAAQGAGAQPAASALAPPATDSPLATVQRSWLTIKQAFR